jgi:hypothetical protein
MISNGLKCEQAPLSPMLADWVTLTPGSTLTRETCPNFFLISSLLTPEEIRLFTTPIPLFISIQRDCPQDMNPKILAQN